MPQLVIFYRIKLVDYFRQFYFDDVCTTTALLYILDQVVRSPTCYFKSIFNSINY